MKNEITYGIDTKLVYEIIGIQYISLTLTHFSVALKQPRMSKHLFWQWKSECHEHDRPINRMETQNIFSDQMKICRPEFVKHLIAVSVLIITKSGNVVAQRIDPNIYDVARIKVYRNAPFETGSGNTEILKSRQKEIVHHFVFTRLRLDKFRMCVNMFDQAVLIFA